MAPHFRRVSLREPALEWINEIKMQRGDFRGHVLYDRGMSSELDSPV